MKESALAMKITKCKAEMNALMKTVLDSVDNFIADY